MATKRTIPLLQIDPRRVEHPTGTAFAAIRDAADELRVLGKQIFAASDSDRDFDPLEGSSDVPHLQRARELKQVAIGTAALAQQALTCTTTILAYSARLSAIADLLDSVEPERRTR